MELVGDALGRGCGGPSLSLLVMHVVMNLTFHKGRAGGSYVVGFFTEFGCGFGILYGCLFVFLQLIACWLLLFGQG